MLGDQRRGQHRLAVRQRPADHPHVAVSKAIERGLEPVQRAPDRALVVIAVAVVAQAVWAM